MALDEKNARIAYLNEEMDAIHYANSLYWNQGKSQTIAARAEYHFRLNRLEKIRTELDQLRSSRAVGRDGVTNTTPRGCLN